MKNIPERTCIACRTVKPKSELIRVVKSPDGEISLDFTGKKAGRGAYICDDMSCFEKCVKQRSLNRTFKTEIDKSVYDKITEDYVAKKQG